jgi:hypothetical protein
MPNRTGMTEWPFFWGPDGELVKLLEDKTGYM